MDAKRRLTSILRSLTTSSPVWDAKQDSVAAAPQISLGTLTIGDLQVEVKEAADKTRLVHARDGALLDVRDPGVKDGLYFLLQKDKLGQDVFLVNSPGGPFARRLALTFCHLLNREYEFVELHRDVGEAELKQGREIRTGGTLEYIDSPAVRAVKGGHILIIEGIEKAERGILPILNNLLENREVNLEDGTHIVHPSRLDSLVKDNVERKNFIPAHPNFRVIAIGASVPPHVGFPLDPPFRSRFQVRYLDRTGASTSLARQIPLEPASNILFEKVREVVMIVDYSSDIQQPLSSSKSSSVPIFPQTALTKLSLLLKTFKVAELSAADLARALIMIHPALTLMSQEGWRSLKTLFEQVNLQISDTIPGVPKDGSGFLGYRLTGIQRHSQSQVTLVFENASDRLTLPAHAGPLKLRPYPFHDETLLQSTRFQHIMNTIFQAHTLGWDISILPSSLTASTASTTLLIKTFAELLGYQLETVHLYKELGGRELLMRRKIGENGATTWKPSPLIAGLQSGKLVHLAGVDVLGSTFGSLARLLQDRESELWESTRIVGQFQDDEGVAELLKTHESARVIATVSKTTPPKEWLNEELSNILLSVPSIPMDQTEERQLLSATGLDEGHLDVLQDFTRQYRSHVLQTEQKSRKLGTRTLIRIANRLKLGQGQALYDLIMRSLLAEFLPTSSKDDLSKMLTQCRIEKGPAEWLAPAIIKDNQLHFGIGGPSGDTSIPLFDHRRDPDGVSHVPYMTHYFDNAQQTVLMRDMAIDLELLGEHLLLLGNQGVGKNKIIDRLLQLLNRPREYIQLHRDSTVQSLMFQTTLEEGKIRYHDSPMLRAIIKGRVLVVDEADKAPEYVVAIFKSLAEQGEMTLSDGRRICPSRQSAHDSNDIIVHPSFRMVLLANRPGFPFLGNAFLTVLGDAFSSHAVANPDQQSEVKLLMQLAPEMDPVFLQKLVKVFQDLRLGFEEGTLSYPYSLRELINLVKHMKNYRNDSLETALRNIFDFDIHRPDTMNFLWRVLRKHGLPVEFVGIDAVRKSVSNGKAIRDIDFKPEGSTELDEPKFGKVDNEEHHGGNTWAGGTGGRDTAGLGGRGGYMRLFKGFDIHQIPDDLKKDVPEHIQERARQMAKEELARKLQELDMSNSQAIGYESYMSAVRTHIERLRSVLENASANEEERVWLKRQSDGELDETRLTEGLTGESAIYKRRGMEKPEVGRPQIKPKRMDGRLSKSLETAVMLMESFASLRGKDENKYAIDFYAHSGDSPSIKLIELDHLPQNELERWKVVERMALCTQYCFAGDYTLEALSEAGKAVSEPKDAYDDRFVIALTDANFERYGISAQSIRHEMEKDWNVKKILIAIGDPKGAAWLPQLLPGRGYVIENTGDLPRLFQTILQSTIAN